MRLACDISKRNEIKNLIKELERYRDELDMKCEIFVSRLAEVGINSVKASLGSISAFYKGDTNAFMDGVYRDGDGYKAIIRMSGTDAIFIEFGSGTTFNTSVGGSLHPKGKELGYTIGSYPGQTRAADPTGWWYYDKWGNSQHTYGTPTFAPMYNSFLEMHTQIMEIAKEVFR